MPGIRQWPPKIFDNEIKLREVSFPNWLIPPRMLRVLCSFPLSIRAFGEGSYLFEPIFFLSRAKNYLTMEHLRHMNQRMKRSGSVLFQFSWPEAFQQMKRVSFLQGAAHYGTKLQNN